MSTYEYSQLMVWRDTSVPGGGADWPVKYKWLGPNDEEVELGQQGEGIMRILSDLGKDGWRLVGTPEVERSFVWALHTQARYTAAQYRTSASDWLLKRWWLIRER